MYMILSVFFESFKTKTSLQLLVSSISVFSRSLFVGYILCEVIRASCLFHLPFNVWLELKSLSAVLKLLTNVPMLNSQSVQGACCYTRM